MRLPKISAKKARKILDDGKVAGKKLSRQQIAFFQMIVSGETPGRLNDIPQKARKRIAA